MQGEAMTNRIRLFLCRRRSVLAAQIEADQFILATGVEEPISQGRVRADLSGQDLGAGGGLEAVRRGGGADKFAPFSQNEQLVAGDGYGGGAEGFLLPTDVASRQLDAAQTGRRLESGIGPAMNPVK